MVDSETQQGNSEQMVNMAREEVESTTTFKEGPIKNTAEKSVNKLFASLDDSSKYKFPLETGQQTMSQNMWLMLQWQPKM